MSDELLFKSWEEIAALSDREVEERCLDILPSARALQQSDSEMERPRSKVKEEVILRLVAVMDALRTGEVFGWHRVALALRASRKLTYLEREALRLPNIEGLSDGVAWRMLEAHVCEPKCTAREALARLKIAGADLLTLSRSDTERTAIRRVLQEIDTDLQRLRV
jgi:hypothetical protein